MKELTRSALASILTCFFILIGNKDYIVWVLPTIAIYLVINEYIEQVINYLQAPKKE